MRGSAPAYAADYFAVGEHVEVIVIPLAGRAAGRCAFEDCEDMGLHVAMRAPASTYLQAQSVEKSLAVDIEQARGRELIRAIVPKADVVVENFTPGVMARAGLGYD